MRHRLWIESCALLGTFVLCAARTQGDWIERLLSPVAANQSGSTLERATGTVGPSSKQCGLRRGCAAQVAKIPLFKLAHRASAMTAPDRAVEAALRAQAAAQAAAEAAAQAAAAADR